MVCVFASVRLWVCVRAQGWKCLLFILGNSKCAQCEELMGLTAFVCSRIQNMNFTTTSTQETERESRQREKKSYKQLQPQHLSFSIWGHTIFPKTVFCNCSHCFYQHKISQKWICQEGMKAPADAQHRESVSEDQKTELLPLRLKNGLRCLCVLVKYGFLGK